MRVIALLLTAFILTGLSPTTGWCLDCANPPRGTYGKAWWNKYADWCSSCGGTPNASSQSCTPGPNWGGGRSGGFTGSATPELMMMQMVMQFGFDLLGKQMECAFNPSCEANGRREEEKRNLAAERAQIEAEERAAEDDRQQREKEQRQRFEAEKQRLFGEMRLQPGSGELKPRNLGLDTRETGGALQARLLAPRDPGAATTTGAASLGSPAARLRCGAFLLRKADEAAARNDLQEAAFLSNEAAALMGGEKATTAVECPPAGDVPSLGDGAEIETEQSRQARLEIERALQQRSVFMRGMYRRVSEQGAKYRQATEELRQAEERQKEAEASLGEARRRRAEIEATLASPPAAPNPPQGGQPSAAKPDPGAESALAEALAAMQAAEAAYAGAQAEVQAGVEQKAGLERQMEETRSMFDRARKDPAEMGKALEKLQGSSHTGGDS